MTWFAAVVLALAAFGLAAFAFRIARPLYTTLLATLSLGLAGYALQASPDVPSAPHADPVTDPESQYDIVAARAELMGLGDASRADLTVLADAMARRGRYPEAAQYLMGVTRDDPNDFEAWVAAGNALVEHTGGVLTPASLYAYRRASDLKPNHLAPGYFLGVALIRQGAMMEARQVWSDTLAAAPEDAAGREQMAFRLGMLEQALGIVPAEQAAAPADATPAGQGVAGE